MPDLQLQEINRTYKAMDGSRYPEDFLREYTLMECLAEHNGADTFVVQDHKGDQFAAKCYSKESWTFSDSYDVLIGLQGKGLPRHVALFENDVMWVSLREYIEGVPLDRYAGEQALRQQEIVDICLQLCDILAVLHHRPAPVIHRDIKPQNVIIDPEGGVHLIDFDIARVYREGSDTDTRFFGTVAYAPPEQYGFSQTDARADIYALGVLLRYLLTGSARENPNIRLYKPLAKIIGRCTAFAPDKRYADVDDVAKALRKANPKAQRIRAAKIAACGAAVCVLMGIGAYEVYDYMTFDPFGEGHIPSVLQDEERAADAVSYLAEKYDAHMFDDTAECVTMGMMREALIKIYGLDPVYVNTLATIEPPDESEECFYPWGKGDEQYVNQYELAYTVVKVYWPDVITDWSSLKDDNGEYPGARVAMNWCEEYGILTGVNRTSDLTQGEAAIAFANADRVYNALQKEKSE